MMFSGMSYTLAPAVVAAIFAGPLWLLWLPIGALKGPAYILGKRFEFPQIGLGSTVIGEYLTGGFMCAWSGLMWAWLG